MIAPDVFLKKNYANIAALFGNSLLLMQTSFFPIYTTAELTVKAS